MNNVNAILLGDTKVGKSSLILKLCTNNYTDEYIESEVIDLNSISLLADTLGKACQYSFWDTCGRDLSNPPNKYYIDSLTDAINTVNIIIFCYAKDSIDSYMSLLSRWLPFVVKNAPNTPAILCCLKDDLEIDSSSIKIQQNVANMCQLLSCSNLITCSCSDDNNDDIDRVFMNCLALIVKNHEETKDGTIVYEERNATMESIRIWQNKIMNILDEYFHNDVIPIIIEYTGQFYGDINDIINIQKSILLTRSSKGKEEEL